MTEFELEDLKKTNPIKYLEVVPQEAMRKIRNIAALSGIFNKLSVDNMPEMNSKTNDKINKIIGEPVDFRRATIGGLIYILGNAFSKYTKKGGIQ
jgi:hypothetical protein